jgi:hypothetical protein
MKTIRLELARNADTLTATRETHTNCTSSLQRMPG